MIQAPNMPMSPHSLQNCFDLVDYFTPVASDPKSFDIRARGDFNCHRPKTNAQLIVYYRSAITQTEMAVIADETDINTSLCNEHHIHRL